MPVRIAIPLILLAFGCHNRLRERLVRMDSIIDPFVAEGKVPGVVALVMKDGEVVYEHAAGWADRERKIAMRTDTIFRIASQTKAMTTVAALMLVEEGKLAPSDHLGKFIPAFYRAHVAVRVPGSEPSKENPYKYPTELKRLQKPITIEHLLTHTSGISYGVHPNIADAYKERGFGPALGHAWYIAARHDTICEAATKLATLPLMAQPGERWIYGYSTDILGCVVEKASGMKLDEFFRVRITEPLGMKDTRFYLTATELDRFAVQYVHTKKEGLQRAPFQGAYAERAPRAFSGGAGLVSTAQDYARFLEMLRRGGEFDGTRYLKPETVAAMTANHVGKLYEEADGGFGYGFEITQSAPADFMQPPGAYGWYGILGTLYRVYPQEHVVICLYTQMYPRDADLRTQFFAELYRALH